MDENGEGDVKGKRRSCCRRDKVRVPGLKVWARIDRTLKATFCEEVEV